MTAILDLASGSLLNVTINVVMKVTNEKKGIFSSYSDDMSKKLNEIHFHYSGLNVSIESVNSK